MNEHRDLPAGDFSSWVRRFRRSLALEDGTAMDCQGCDACCTSSYFIHIGPGEARTLGRIDKRLLAAAPGLPKGHVLLGYDRNGRCPLLAGGGCSIYVDRPATCRMYDCRVFAAAGIAAGGDDKARISRSARRWKFSYPTKLDRDEHAAVRAAAAFVRGHAACFPGGAIPDNASQLAILAVKVYEVFLENGAAAGAGGRTASDREIAAAIVQASRKFDRAEGWAPRARCSPDGALTAGGPVSAGEGGRAARSRRRDRP